MISIYGAGEITPAQFLSEFMVKRRADKEKLILPKMFWRNKEGLYDKWIKTLKVELIRANGLIRAGYSHEVIIAALNSREGKFMLSLHNKKLPYLLSEYQRKLTKVEVAEVKTIEKEVDITYTPNQTVTSKPSKLSRLRD